MIGALSGAPIAIGACLCRQQNCVGRLSPSGVSRHASPAMSIHKSLNIPHAMRKIVATFFAAFSLAFLATLPALAQSTQAMPVRQAAPSPAMKVAVRRMLDAMQFPQLTRSIFDQMLQSVPSMIRQSAQQQINSNPKLDEQRKARALASAEEEIPLAIATLTQVLADPTLIDELGDEMVPLYARFYTVPEVEQLTAFYKTPLGRKMLATMPQLSAESMAISQRVLIPRVNAVLDQVMRAATQSPQ
ncbi:DUF2059 domain-containing protein [Janthinobacterium sp. KBS0711]|nr:DUF2059 domain-containing protein [Janthinobacterium sp. KBS0711]